jgi:type IV fimbrial biogenesis protein FimT
MMIRKPQNDGFTLLELMVTIAVIAIIVTIGIPSFQALIDRNRLRGATENLFVDLNFARSESIKQNRRVAVYFSEPSASWCYGIDDNIDPDNLCDCAASPANCTVNGIQKVVSSTDYPGVVLNENLFTDYVVGFDPTRGLPAEGNAFSTLDSETNRVTFQSASLGKNGRVELSVLGRINTVYP